MNYLHTRKPAIIHRCVPTLCACHQLEPDHELTHRRLIMQ